MDLPSPVLIYDDDHHYIANVLAELLAKHGKQVVFLTPMKDVASWSHNTYEQSGIMANLLALRVELRLARRLHRADANVATATEPYEGKQETIEFGSILLVTARVAAGRLHEELDERAPEFPDRGIQSVTRIGGCLAPGLIGAAVFSGHEFAPNLE